MNRELIKALIIMALQLLSTVVDGYQGKTKKEDRDD
jgi:hypothetical protein